MSGETDRELAKLQCNEQLLLTSSNGTLRLMLTRLLSNDSVYVKASMPQDLLEVSIVQTFGDTLAMMRAELDKEQAKSDGSET